MEKCGGSMGMVGSNLRDGIGKEPGRFMVVVRVMEVHLLLSIKSTKQIFN